MALGGGGWVDVGGGWLEARGVGGWGCGVVGGAPTHVHTHTHACMHTHAHACVCKHDNFMQMAAPIGGIPGNSL